MRLGKVADAWQRPFSVFLFGAVIISTLLRASSTVMAAETPQPFLIGALTPSWGPTPATVGLRDGLVALGYREHEQFDIGVRFTQGDLHALPTAAHQLVQFGVNLIFAFTTDAALAAQKVTTQLPIVFGGVVYPIESGLIQSFARPGGNITGVTELREELSPKRLELFHLLVPHMQQVLYPYDPRSVASAASVKIYREAAHKLGITLIELPLQTEVEAQAAIAQAHTDGIDGLLQPPSLSLNIPGLILEATSQHSIPAIFDSLFYVENGGFASYGPAFYESGRQAARLVDKIMRGANPSELPVEANPKIEFVINLKTAKTLGLTIPPEVLYRADRLVR